jgi:metal-sulfur cluster biosynthetic enzyme
MTTLTPDLVTQALRTVNDPELHKDLVTLEMVKGIQIDGNTVTVGIELTTPACPMKDRIRNDVTAAIAAQAATIGAPTPQVVVEFTADVRRPNQKARIALFKVHTKNVPLAADVNLERLATATVGGMPRKTRIGAIRKPPPMPNRPETNPTTAPRITRVGQFTETSAIGR